MADPSFQLQLTQKLALAPQLQQAIKLLQLTRIELREYIQQTVEANPILDYEEPGMDSDPEAAEEDWESKDEYSETDDYASDDDWSGNEPLLDQYSSGGSFEGEDRQAQIADTSDDTLRDHLLFQISLGQFSDLDSAIAGAIVYALDEDGFLADSIQDIRASLAPEQLVDEEQVLSVLRRIQRMEPVGVATRDPAECIRVQLQALPSSTPGLELARRIARSFIHLVADHEMDRLGKETNADQAALDVALDLIRSLEPRPGARFDNRQDEYLVPDVYVRQVEGRWVTHLSPDNDPRLRLNDYYIRLLRQSGGKDREYLNGRLQEARWLLSSLELRNRTLLMVSQSIVDRQSGFLEEGEMAMRPLILKDIAEVAGVHESTVSRATTRKYMLTPRGLFELKYFFSSHVRTMDGGTISAVAVKARIAALIDKEPHSGPLSDLELSRLLRELGVNAARRTVAKYREALGIGSSNERKRAYRRMAGLGNSPNGV
jgi:RNA polymerase sigma-54 factor